MLWKESLRMQAESLLNIVQAESFSKDVESVIAFSKGVKGFHFFSGIGKNMFVAARVASTFDSLGIRSLYIDPVNTLHGSMGIFDNSDVLIAISKSGETYELNRFVKALISTNFKNIISITSNRNSTLSKLSMYTVEVPVKQEGDHLGLAPISSTMLYSAVLDSIAVQLSSEKGYGKRDFLRNHPGGSLGKITIEE